MTSRRRGGNPASSSPALGRYEFRDRTKSVQQPSVSTITTSETDPQLGSQGDVSGFGRPLIKNAGKERKPRTVEQNVKPKSTKRTAMPVEPDIDDDSDGSDYSNSSRGLPENVRQSHLISTKYSSKSSAKRPPSPPRQFDKYSDDDTKSSLFRPPIRSSVGSAKKQPPQASQRVDSTNETEPHGGRKETLHDDKEKTKDYKEVTCTGSIKTQQSQSSFEDQQEKALQYQQKTKDQLNERTLYKEERESWRSTNRREELILHHRRQQPPKESTKTQPALSRAHIGFSDDDEEGGTRYQKRAVPRIFAEGNKINHYPEKENEQKAKVIRKPPTKSSLHFSGTCIKYLVAVALVLLVGSAAVLYISPESDLKIIGQVLFADKPQVKKDLKDDFEKLSSIFTDQSQQMWNRSRRILELHLENWKGNAEPAIILLTGARNAEKTLLCLGTQLADIYSSSVSGSYIVISGTDLVSGSSEEVKEYIDDRLSAAFQATSQAAVLHRLELLPAGSLLILYKYCDHESAVFKNVMLLLTVLLDDTTLEKDIPLTDLEENVRAFLIQKLIDSNTKASHDGMDRDKFSGVWSRISHVVLPVFPEKNMEHCAKKPN